MNTTNKFEGTAAEKSDRASTVYLPDGSAEITFTLKKGESEYTANNIIDFVATANCEMVIRKTLDNLYEENEPYRFYLKVRSSSGNYVYNRDTSANVAGSTVKTGTLTSGETYRVSLEPITDGPCIIYLYVTGGRFN